MIELNVSIWYNFDIIGKLNRHYKTKTENIYWKYNGKVGFES